MPRYKINYREGDCFSMPLRSGGYGTGVIGRKGRGAILIGFFFGPRLAEIPDQTFADTLSLENAINVKKFGDLSLVTNEWTVFESISNWSRDTWYMPKFVWFDGNNPDIAELITYDERNLSRISERETVPASEALNHYEDVMSGYGAVEIDLTRRLDPEW